MCGLRWTLKPGKVQGIEKTCRLNTAVSNFLDPTPESFLFPEISPFPTWIAHLPRPADLSATPRTCTTPCYHANVTSIVSMGQSEFFLRFTPKGAARRGPRARGVGSEEARRGRFVAGEGLPGRMDRGRPRHPPALLSSLSRWSDRHPHRGVGARPGGFSSCQAA